MQGAAKSKAGLKEHFTSSVKVRPGTPGTEISGERVQKRQKAVFTEFIQKAGQMSAKTGLLKKLSLKCAFA